MTDHPTARQKIANLLWWSIPSHDTDEAKAKAEQMLDDHAAEVRRESTELEAATEFRLTPAPPAYTPLIVRRDPAYDGTRWAVLHDPGDIAVRRTWTAEGWEMAWASTDDEIFCWPDAETALAQARRAQGDDDNEPDIDGAGRTYESYRPRAAENLTPAPTPAPLAASHGPAGDRDGETGAEGAAGSVEPSRRALTPNEYDAAWHAVEGAAGEEGADPGTVLHAILNRLGIEWQDAARPAATEEAAR